LTDAIVNGDKAGIYFLEALQAESEGKIRLKNAPRGGRLFRLKCLIDPKGNPVKPGDVVSWKIDTIKTDEQGKPLTTRKGKDMARRGESLEVRNDAVVDDDGFIFVPYRDASILLHRFGTAETSKCREKTRGNELYFWQFIEQPMWLDEHSASTSEPDGRRGPGRPRGARANSDGGQPIES
jgi:hypothetical protein